MASRSQAIERELAARYYQHGDIAAREELAERLLPLARDLALRYAYTDEPLDDLVQVACLGLLKAIDRFEPGRGNRLTSYAVPTILGELKRHFRDRGWALHMPRALQERALRAGGANEKLTARLGRRPKPRELADELGCSVEDVLEAFEAASTYDTASLDAPFAGEPGEPAALGEVLGSDDGAYSLVETREVVSATWRDLPELEREVVRLRFVHDLTQREIGHRVGVSQMHVSRLLRRALTRLQSSAARAA
jgi:RNA polymerase sigma-B factor